MKLHEELKIIDILSNLKEGEKIYLSDSSGFILNEGELFGFDELKNKVYRSRYTKEQYIDIKKNNIKKITKSIEIIHKLLVYIDTTSIDLDDSDVVACTQYDSNEICEIFIKSMINNHLLLITYWKQCSLNEFEMRVFDIDLNSFYLTLSILKGDGISDSMDYFKKDGFLSAKSISIINKEINGKNRQSILNTSCDMYFNDCISFTDMIKETKKSYCRKKIKSRLSTL